MVKRALIAAFTAGLAMATPPAGAAPPQWHACHTSDVKALKIFTVGEASLSRRDCQAKDLLAPPVRLTFRYFRDVPGDAFAKAAMNFLEKNLDTATFKARQEQFQTFNRHYQDIGDGDAYTLTHRVDGTLLLALNGKELTRQQDQDFARLYLTIWFGDSPYSSRLKANLLGH